MNNIPGRTVVPSAQLVDSGATKQQGVVKKMTHDYGFLQSLSSPDTVYFNSADVVQGSREGERPRVGSQVNVLALFRRWSRLCFFLTFVVVAYLENYRAPPALFLFFFFLQDTFLASMLDRTLKVDRYNTCLCALLPRQAEFWVVPDRIKNRESFRALEVRILLPGTLKLEEETHKNLQGTVERAPTLPQRQGFREGALRPCRSC